MCLPLAFTACGPEKEVVTQIVIKPVAPEPVPDRLKEVPPLPKCPTERSEYEVPKLEARARCFEKDSTMMRAHFGELVSAVKDREDRTRSAAK